VSAPLWSARKHYNVSAVGVKYSMRDLFFLSRLMTNKRAYVYRIKASIIIHTHERFSCQTNDGSGF